MANTAAIVDAYRLMTGKTRAQALRMAESLWLGMDSWSDAAADRLVQQTVPIVIGAEQNTAAATIAYLQALTGATTKVDFAQVTGAAIRGGADPVEVYHRPVIEARAVYSRAEIVDLAVEVGLRRLLGTVSTDLQLASTHTANQVLLQTGVETYRRVTRPGACPLCVAASDRVYTTGMLAPIHSNCHCVTIPGDRVPRTLQGKGLQTPADLPPGRLVLDFNAELGPVLDWDAHIAALPASKGGRKKRGIPAASPQASRDLKAAQLAGYEQVLAAGGGTDWMRDKAAQLRADLAT
jgi:hypothetical protein